MISRYGFVQVGDIVSGDHFDFERQLLGVIDSYDKKIINLLWRNQLDQWTFLVLFSNEVNIQQARILFEANFKQKPISLKFIKTKNNHELITNPYVRENTKIAVVRVDKNVILEINDKMNYEELQRFEFIKKEIKTNYHLSKK